MSLYIVATPIGNLDDISARALKVLAEVDLIAAEDTRHSRALLQRHSIETRVVAYHDHNELAAAESLVEKMSSGLELALISDAGTPLISDPGFNLVRLAHDRGIRIVPVPGPSAMLAALSVSGLPTDRFRFEGFLPAKTIARQSRLAALKKESSTLVFYEAPHRIKKTLDDLSQIFGGERKATIARELTKKFEQVAHSDLNQLNEALATGEIVSKGEFFIVVAGSRESTSNFDEIEMMQILLRELPPRKAADIAHKITGAGKKHLYNLSLELKNNK